MKKAQPEFDNNATDAENFRFAIVLSRWNSDFTERLLDGANDALRTRGVTGEAIEVFRVPGAFELPLACLKVAETGRFDAVIALGVVIRGETPHFEYVAGAAASGITDASLRSGVPILFGVITAENEQQTLDRCGDGPANKGHEAAMAAIDVASLYRRMAEDQGLMESEKGISHVV